jgi:hypothetical protein
MSIYSEPWYREQVLKAERQNREHLRAFDRSFMGKLLAGDERERDDDGTEKRVDHHASTVADLLVESGRFPHRTAALDHLLNSSRGQALLQRTRKAAVKTEKEHPMDTVFSIMKSGGIAATCAAIVAKGSTTISQDELVEAVSKVAHERYPELSSAQAFEKVYSDQGAEGRALRQAINVAKASLAETMLGPALPCDGRHWFGGAKCQHRRRGGGGACGADAEGPQAVPASH